MIQIMKDGSGKEEKLNVCTVQRRKKRRKKRMNKARAVLEEVLKLKETEFIYLPFATREDLNSFKSSLHRERMVIRRMNLNKEIVIKQEVEEVSNKFALRIYAVENTFRPVIVSKDTGSVRPMEFVEQAQEVTWNPPSPLSPSHVGHETDAERIARLMREDGVEETVISEIVGRIEDGDNRTEETKGGPREPSPNNQGMEYPLKRTAEVTSAIRSEAPQAPEDKGREES